MNEHRDDTTVPGAPVPQVEPVLYAAREPVASDGGSDLATDIKRSREWAADD